MNHWPFIIGAYLLTGSSIAILLVWSFRQMQSAERRARELNRRS